MFARQPHHTDGVTAAALSTRFRMVHHYTFYVLQAAEFLQDSDMVKKLHKEHGSRVFVAQNAAASAQNSSSCTDGPAKACCFHHFPECTYRAVWVCDLYQLSPVMGHQLSEAVLDQTAAVS